MAKKKFTDEQIEQAMKDHGSFGKAAAALGMDRRAFSRRATRIGIPSGNERAQSNSSSTECRVDLDDSKGTGTITTKSLNIHTVEQALAYSDVDTSVWEVDRYLINSWEVTMGKKATNTERPETYTNYQVKLWLKRKENKVLAGEALLRRIESKSPIVKNIKRRKINPKKARYELEIDIMDPHIGLYCLPSGSDAPWSPERAWDAVMWSVDHLLYLAEPFGQIERIVWPFGNDWLHTDNVWGKTTKGTEQPEAMSWEVSYDWGEALAINVASTLARVAPLKIIAVPGNHDRATTLTLGRLLRAHFKNNANVDVDSTIPVYRTDVDARRTSLKVDRFGKNAKVYEHGHSIKPIRMASLAAQECRRFWNETTFTYWQCGDQHRQGSSKPVEFEEYGVSINFCPSLVPANEWHKINGYNWQQRGSTGFLREYDSGEVARLKANWNSYTDEPADVRKIKQTIRNPIPTPTLN